MSNQIKVIQSRLKRLGRNASLEQIRTHCADVEITPEMVPILVEELINDSCGIVPVSESGLCSEEQQKIVAQTAYNIDVSLPSEALSQIASSIDWAIESRSKLMQELRSAIRLWAKHKLEEAQKAAVDIRNETNQLYAEISSTINGAIEEDNQQFSAQAEQLKQQINQAVESFRSTQSQIINIFKVPS